MHVVSAEVERPSDFVEGGKDDGGSSVLADGCADAGNLVRARLTGISDVVDEDRRLGEGRTVFPDKVERVFIADDKLQSACFQPLAEGFGFLHGVHPSVDTHSFTFLQHRAEPFGDGRCFGQTVFEQADARAFELFFRLEKITGVRPKSGIIQRNHRGASRAGETAYPLACLPMFGHIFAGVRVGARHDERRESLLLHKAPQSLYSVFDVNLLFHRNKLRWNKDTISM